ncbi:hypothetical protein ABPG74_015969 [Tetrahymena malaccensis]
METIQIREDLKQSVLKFIIQDVEIKYDVKVLFCAETGSRGYHTHTSQSDLDVKGFYVSKTEDYLRTNDKKKILQKTHHFLKLEDGSEIEFDYTFLDIRKFLKRKLRPNKIDQMNLWVMSESVYLNKFDEDTLKFFQKELKLPYAALNGHMKTYLKIFSKQNPTLKVKEILTSIIVGFQLLHMIIFKENPIYQTWKQQNYLKQYVNSLREQSKEVPLPLQNIEDIQKYALELYELKKEARKGELDQIEPPLLEWMQQVINFYKDFQEQTLGQDYCDSPEISQSRADEIFSKMRKIADENL